MYCKNCGASLEDSDQFCTQCGTPINFDKKPKDKEQHYFENPNIASKVWNIKDFYSLYILALRDYFWQIDRKADRKMQDHGTLGKLAIILSYIFPVLCAYMLYKTLISTTDLLWAGKFFRGLRYFFKEIIDLGFTSAILFAIFCDLGRAWYLLNYRKNAWWNNTLVTPNEIRTAPDKGLYGEFVATMSVERQLNHAGTYGKIFNSVILPKRNGDFTEIDIVSVNEYGIFVVEAKGRGGIIRGNVRDRKWKQSFQWRGEEVDERDMESPFLQNLHHCNFLNEYLYENLPDGPLKEKWNYANLMNVVLFTIHSSNLFVDFSGVCGLRCFVGFAEHGNNPFRKYSAEEERKIFSRDDVDLICNILAKLPRYTEEERERMSEERNDAYDREEFASRYKYFLGLIEYDKNGYTEYAICRSDGNYTTIANDDGFFLSCPEAHVSLSGKKYRLLEDIPEEEIHSFAHQVEAEQFMKNRIRKAMYTDS